VEIQLPNDRFDVSDGFLKLDYVTITGAVGTSTNSAAVQITGGGVSACLRGSLCASGYFAWIVWCGVVMCEECYFWIFYVCGSITEPDRA
jgi:hypothetical protein